MIQQRGGRMEGVGQILTKGGCVYLVLTGGGRNSKTLPDIFWYSAGLLIKCGDVVIWRWEN